MNLLIKKKKMKKIKKFYKTILLVLLFIFNTFIGFQVCPNLLSSESNILVIFAIIIFVAIVCPIYYFLTSLLIKKI